MTDTPSPRSSRGRRGTDVLPDAFRLVDGLGRCAPPVVRRGGGVPRDDLRSVGLESRPTVPERPAQVDVVEDRRSRAWLRGSRCDRRAEPSLADRGPNRAEDMQSPRLLHGRPADDRIRVLQSLDVSGREKRVRPVEADALRRCADVVEPACRDETAAPGITPGRRPPLPRRPARSTRAAARETRQRRRRGPDPGTGARRCPRGRGRPPQAAG